MRSCVIMGFAQTLKHLAMYREFFEIAYIIYREIKTHGSESRGQGK